MSDLNKLSNYLQELLNEKNEDFALADGADSNFHYLEGFVDSLDHVIGVIKEGVYK